MSVGQEKEANLGQWIKNNPGFFLNVIVLVVGGGIAYGSISNQLQNRKDWEATHLAAHSLKAQENEGRFARLEAKIQPIETVVHRMGNVEGAVNNINMRLDKQAESNTELTSRITRIETLLETILARVEGRVGRK